MFCKEAGKGASEESQIRSALRIVQLARENNWLSTAEVKQILYCQDHDGKRFGQVAVRRNFLAMSQVRSLLSMQTSMQTSMQGNLPVRETGVYQIFPVFSQLETDRR